MPAIHLIPSLPAVLVAARHIDGKVLVSQAQATVKTRTVTLSAA